MPIPNFQTLMLPLLKLASDRLEHSFKDAIPFLSEKFDLTENEKQELLPSGKQSKFNKRVYLTKTHLFKAGLLDSDRRGAFRITEEGLRVLATNPLPIDTKFLEQYETYREFRTPAKQKKYILPKTTSATGLTTAKKRPEKALEDAYQRLQAVLSLEILNKIHRDPCCFESLVIDLLFSMGHGTRIEVSEALGRSRDKTLDGMINADKLNLNPLYVEAHRLENKVTKSEIQGFTEAVIDRSASQGIFITTSDFSQKAMDYISQIESKIILIDGQQLAELAIAHNIGVTSVLKYEIKQIDSDYFAKNYRQ